MNNRPQYAEIERAGSLETENVRSQGQWNLFTGELEPISESPKPETQPETQWLFDPDFRLVLPEDRAGKEILVEDGIVLNFPGLGIGDRFQVTGGGRAPRTVENPKSQIGNDAERGAEGAI
jgi:hypothetical protein